MTAMQHEIHRRLSLGLTIQPPNANRRRLKRRSRRFTFQGWPYALSIAVVIAGFALLSSIFIF